MRVKCVGKARAELRTESALSAYDRNVHLEEVDLEKGAVYDVFGIVFRDGDGEPWYLVCDEEASEYPTPELGAFFEVVDPSIPSGWAVSCGGNLGRFGLLPRRWAEDPGFMERLIDGDPQARDFFARLRNELRETTND